MHQPRIHQRHRPRRGKVWVSLCAVVMTACNPLNTGTRQHPPGGLHHSDHEPVPRATLCGHSSTPRHINDPMSSGVNRFTGMYGPFLSGDIFILFLIAQEHDFHSGSVWMCDGNRRRERDQIDDLSTGLYDSLLRHET